MSFLDQSKWKKWAEEWGLIHFPQKALSYPNEWMAGPHQGRLIKVSWSGGRYPRLYVMVRFPKVESADILRENVRRDDNLAKLPGWKRIKPQQRAKVLSATPASGATLAPAGLNFKQFNVQWGPAQDLVVGERALVWSHSFSWSRPNAAKIRDWVERLVQTVSRWTAPFQGRCESCNSAQVDRFVLFEGVPVLMCSACRDRLSMEGHMAQQRYDEEEANYTLGIAYGVMAAIVGGAIWALIAAWTGRIFAALAIGIGFIVALGYKLGAKKVDRIGQIFGAVLTLASVVLGMIFFYAYQVMAYKPELGFRLDAGVWVFLKVLEESPADIILPLFFGAIGAFVAVSALAKPRFAPKIEAPEEAARPGMKKAA